METTQVRYQLLSPKVENFMESQSSKQVKLLMVARMLSTCDKLQHPIFRWSFPNLVSIEDKVRKTEELFCPVLLPLESTSAGAYLNTFQKELEVLYLTEVPSEDYLVITLFLVLRFGLFPRFN